MDLSPELRGLVEFIDGSVADVVTAGGNEAALLDKLSELAGPFNQLMRLSSPEELDFCQSVYPGFRVLTLLLEKVVFDVSQEAGDGELCEDEDEVAEEIGFDNSPHRMHH